jgi:hypothetical protein
MVKLGSAYSQAFGFKLVEYMQTFMTENPKQAKEIQQICDDDFKETCFKCYPIVISTGIDPATYEPKVVNPSTSASIRNSLREAFPIEVIDLEECETADELEEDQPKNTTPKPESPKPESPVKFGPWITKKKPCQQCVKNQAEINKLVKEKLQLENQIKSMSSKIAKYEEQEKDYAKSVAYYKKMANNSAIDYRVTVEQRDKLIQENVRMKNQLTDPNYEMFILFNEFKKRPRS